MFSKSGISVPQKKTEDEHTPFMPCSSVCRTGLQGWAGEEEWLGCSGLGAETPWADPQETGFAAVTGQSAGREPGCTAFVEDFVDMFPTVKNERNTLGQWCANPRRGSP